MSFVEHFKREYYQKLLTPNGNNPVRNRADSLLKVFEILESKNKAYYTIVESGCLRLEHGEDNFGGDGCSSVIFDDFTFQHQNFHNGLGSFTSVDINEENCKYAQSKLKSRDSKVIHSDSVKYLWSIPDTTKIDLLYCDSFDIIESNPHPSMLHHVLELSATINKLVLGSLVVVDDHRAFFNDIGKGNYIKEFADKVGWKTVFEGYQIVFEVA